MTAYIARCSFEVPFSHHLVVCFGQAVDVQDLEGQLSHFVRTSIVLFVIGERWGEAVGYPAFSYIHE